MPALALTLQGQTTYLEETDGNRQDAMARFWQAGQDGDTTASLRRVDLVPPQAANSSFDEPDDDPPTPAAPAVACVVEPGEISPVAVSRIRLQEAWCAKAGFALAPPLFAPGTRVLPLGDRNFRTERRRVEALPSFSDAAGAVVDAIRDEERRNLTTQAGDLAMTEHGTLLVAGVEHALDLGAFYQLAAHTGFGMGARYLAERCDGDLRSRNVNTQLQKSPGRHLTLRTRQGDDGARVVFATVTPAYATVDTDLVLAALGRHLADARTEMVYDGTGIRATALWMPDQVTDLAAGDIFKAGVRVETDDTGRGRIRVSAVVFRNRCLNLIVIGEGTVETVSAVHKGNPDAILTRITAGVEAARGKIGEFLAAWGHARTVKIDVEATLRAFVEERKLLPRGERDRDRVVGVLLAAWQREPGDTLADAANAVTRAAHEHPLWGMDFREELERQASRLVLVSR